MYLDTTPFLIHLQLYRFLARRTDSNFNKVYPLLRSHHWELKRCPFLTGDPPPPLPFQGQPSPDFTLETRQGDSLDPRP